MITTPSSQKRDTTIELTSLEEIRKEIHTNRDEVNITDGGEFLDDAIRTKDQPLGELTVKKTNERQSFLTIIFFIKKN
jgi:hypothetical protein